jgi:hypothetical protein
MTVLQISLVAAEFLWMFPPDELHQEIHGNLVVHLFAIVSFMKRRNKAFLDNLNAAISNYPRFPGLRRLLRNALYYYTSKKRRAVVLATTLKTGDEMEAFMSISVAVFLQTYGFCSVVGVAALMRTRELPVGILRPWIAHLEAVTIMSAKPYDTANEDRLRRCTAIWMESVQLLVAETGERLNVRVG